MTGAGLRQNTAVYSAAPKATPACVIPRFSSSGAFIFCPFFLVHCKPGGISDAGEALCYQPRLKALVRSDTRKGLTPTGKLLMGSLSISIEAHTIYR